MLSRNVAGKASWVVLVLAAGACGDDEDDHSEPEPAAAIAMQADPSTLNVRAGESATCTVTVTRQAGLVGELAIDVLGLPVAGLTADVGEVGDNPESATVTFTADDDLPAQLHTVWLRATVASAKAAVPVALDVAPPAVMTLSGRVVDNVRQPVADVEVWVGDASTTTDVDGRFTLAGVAAPYDLAVVRPAADELHLFVGLTRPDPTLHLINVQADSSYSANVSGSLSGGAGFPQDADHVTLLAAVGAQARGMGLVLPDAGPGFGPMPVDWFGDESGGSAVETTLHALQWQLDGAGRPAAYTGYGQATATLNGGTGLTGVALPLASLETSYLSASFVAPQDHTVVGAAMWLRFGEQSFAPVVIDYTGDESVTYATPVQPEIAIGLQVTASSAAGVSHAYIASVGESQVIDVTLPAAPALVYPNDGGVIAQGGTLEWTAYVDGVHAVSALSATGPNIGIYTSGTQAVIPNVAGYGLSWTIGATYGWLVQGVAPYASVDEFADASGGISAFGGSRDVSLGKSSVRAATAGVFLP